MYDLLRNEQVVQKQNIAHTVGVFRCVLERTMSRKSALVGTGAIALSPLVAIIYNGSWPVQAGEGKRRKGGKGNFR